MRMILALFTKYIDLIFVLAVGFLSISNIFNPGFFPSHDGEYHVIRFYEFDKALRDGSWYPLWAADLNYTYGSPLFNYVYPLPNYVSSLLHFLGISFVNAFKINLILASITGSIASYLYGRNKFGRWGGVLTSVFYTMAPYRLLDIYIRGSVGEVWALAFLPLCLYLFDRVIKLSNPRNIALAAVSYSLVIFSHNILAFIFTFFLLWYCFFSIILQTKKKQALGRVFFSFLGGLGISSIFIIPAIFEQQYVTGLKIYDVLENFAELYQLLIPSWGSGFSGQSSSSQMSFQIGVANLLVVFLVVFGLFKKNKKKKFMLFYLASFFIFCFMITPYSAFIWERVAIIQYFQFPWRLLSLVILCSAVLAGSITNLYRTKLIYIALLVIIILTTFSYAKAPYFWDRDDNYYITRENFIYGSNSIGNSFQTKWFPQQKFLPQDNKNIRLIENKTAKKIYEVSSAKKQTVIFNVAYFPGWKTYVKGKETKAINTKGKVGVSVPSGKNTVILNLMDTNIRYFAKTISLATALIITLILLKPAVIQYFYARRNR